MRPNHKVSQSYATLLIAMTYLTVPSPALARPIDYELSGVTATYHQIVDHMEIPLVQIVTGTFTFDAAGPTGPILSNPKLEVTGHGPIGVQTFDVACGSDVDCGLFDGIFSNVISATSSMDTASVIRLDFLHLLDGVPDLLSGFSSIFLPEEPDAADEVTGCAFPVGAVTGCPAQAPEPTSLALLAGAIGLLFSSHRWRLRRQ
jgi:hypothetical protein